MLNYVVVIGNMVKGNILTRTLHSTLERSESDTGMELVNVTEGAVLMCFSPGIVLSRKNPNAPPTNILELSRTVKI